MIRMTRLNNQVIVVNSDLIESLEATPDTVVTLTTDRKYVVRESVDELIDRIVAYRRACAVPSWLAPQQAGET